MLSLPEGALHGFTIGMSMKKSHDVHNCSLTFQFNYENVVLIKKKIAKMIFINMKNRKNNNSRVSLFI